jgi:hypothetical protein
LVLCASAPEFRFPRYIDVPGEDAQYFSAIAERSVLPDSSKDGGLASILPLLAYARAMGDFAQAVLTRTSDAERIAALRPFTVEWIVLPAASPTALACPYSNAAAKVCRIAALQYQVAVMGPR